MNTITQFAVRGLWPLALLAMLASLGLSAPAQAQNTAATGMPGIQYEDGITRPTDDSTIFGTMGNMADEDGLSINNIDRDVTWQWSVADAHDGTYTPHPNTTSPRQMRRFIPADADVGKFLQVCASFTDNAGNPEQLCNRIAMNVLDVDDPSRVIGAHEGYVEVFVTATANKPHIFKASDLVFSDNDGDTMTGFRIISLPSDNQGPEGTLRINGVNAGTGCDPFVEISRANIGALSYFPAAGQSPTRGNRPYAAFNVQALSSGPAYNDPCRDHSFTLSSISIRLVADPDSATGEPAVTFASGIEAPTEDSPITADQGSIADTNNTPPTDLGTISWQWSQADRRGGTYTNITGATDAAFTPGDNQAGKFLQVCASFTDEDTTPTGTPAGNRETRCLQLEDAVVNINDAPSGTVTLSGATGTGLESEAISAAAGEDIADPDGLPDPLNQAWQWQQAVPIGNDAPAAESTAWADIEDATMAAFTPDQPQVGQYLRACATFTDNGGTDERVCGNSLGPVVNINDAPVATPKTVTVSTAATASSPHRFSEADFEFTDEDEDNLVSITLASLPSGGGTLSVGETAASVGQMVNRADLGTISYYPAADQMPNPSYDMFTFSVTDDGNGPGGTITDNRTSAAATITISLASSEQMPATGLPAIVGSVTQQGSALSAGLGTVSDANGIDNDTIMWQWQQAAPTDRANPMPPAADSTDWVDIADPAEEPAFTPGQPQVDNYLRVCITFTDNHATNRVSEGPLCSAATADPIGNLNDAPTATDYEYSAEVVTVSDLFIATITPQAFLGAYDDLDGDSLMSVTITEIPPTEHGGLQYGPNGDVSDKLICVGTTNCTDTAGNVLQVSADGAQFVDVDTQTPQILSFNISTTNRNFDFPQTTLKFTLSDGHENSMEATLTIEFGRDTEQQQVQQVGAILSAAAMANATAAIGGALAAPSDPRSRFDLALDDVSLAATAARLRRSTRPAADHLAWYMGTAPQSERQAAYNADDRSAESLLHRLQSMARGDIAMHWMPGSSSMRYWARYQSIDISGNEGEALEYDGSGTGFYLGADRRINDSIRIGLAISSDSADITLDLDGDMMNDEASRSVTSIHPYLHLNLSDSIQARLIAGIGSGDLELKSTANSDATATADLSWSMLAASLSWHRNIRGRLNAIFDGSFQMSDTSNDQAAFTDTSSSLTAADASAGEMAIDAQLRYQGASITPFTNITARKLTGDLSQSLAFDLGIGADLQTRPVIIRLAMTTQLNDTTHNRDTLSLDLAIPPNSAGLSASLGTRHDTLTGRPQWQSTIRWQRRAAELSLAASQSDYRLQARLRW